MSFDQSLSGCGIDTQQFVVIDFHKKREVIFPGSFRDSKNTNKLVILEEFESHIKFSAGKLKGLPFS